jgi:hypothetical protein
MCSQGLAPGASLNCGQCMPGLILIQQRLAALVMDRHVVSNACPRCRFRRPGIPDVLRCLARAQGAGRQRLIASAVRDHLVRTVCTEALSLVCGAAFCP